jgi:DNA repair exonuclease SbcCD ATPase subunit
VSDTTATVETTEAPPPVGGETPPADDFDKDRAMATIKSLRAFEKEAKAKIKRLEEIEAAEEARKTADLSELDKTRKQLAALQADHERAQAALRDARIKDAARAAAATLTLTFQPGALDDAVALGLFSDLEIGEDGKVKGLNDLLKGLQKDRPYLFGAAPNAPDINAGARGNGHTQPVTTGTVRF